MTGLAADPAFICLVDELSLEQHNLSSPSAEHPLKESAAHSTAHVALTETAPGPQPSSPLHLMSSPSSATFDTDFFNQGKLTPSAADHSIFVANSVPATSNEVVIDDDEMDNFLPETQWATSRVVSPIQHITVSPPGLPEETADSVLTPPLPTVPSQDEEVTSAWQDTMQQPATCAESPSHCSVFPSTFLTSEAMIPTPSRSLVLYPTDPYGRSSSRTLLEVVSSGTEGLETLLFSSTSSVPQPSGDGLTQPFPPSGEASVPPEDVLAPGTDRYPDGTTALSQSLKETISPRTSPTAAVSQTALAFSSSCSIKSTSFSSPLALVSFSTQSADVSYDPVLPGNSREASELPGSSVVPNHADDTPVWSPASPLRPHTWCGSCSVASPRHVLSSSLVERDVGSGDSAETMAAWEASSIPPPTSISPPSSIAEEFSEFEEDPQEYNLLFPSRPIVPLSSRFVEISERSLGLSAEVDMRSSRITHVYPSRGPSPPVSLDAASPGSVSAMETQVMPPSVTAVFPSAVPGLLLDSSFSVTADENTPSLASGDPMPFTSYGLEPSVEAPLFPAREPPSVSRHETRSVLGFASSFSPTPPLEISSSAPLSSEGLAAPSAMSSDVSAILSQAFPTLAETLTLSDSLHLQSPPLSVPNFTNLDFSQLRPSSDLLLSASTFLPSYSEMSLLSSFSSTSLALSEAATASPADSEAPFTSVFTETTSYFEFSLVPHESAVPPQVPSSSEPILDILTARAHSASLLTAFQTTPPLTESSLSPTSDGYISAMDDHTSVLASLSTVIPTTTILVIAVSPPSASSAVSEGAPSPVPTDLPVNTTTELSTSPAPTAPDDAVDIIPSSIPEGQNPHESSTALPSPSLHPVSTSTPEAAVTTPAVVTTRPPYMCDITIPDAYLITTGKALLPHLSWMG